MPGPFNSYEISDEEVRLKLGSIWVPQIKGLDVSAQLDQNSGKLVSVSLTHSNSIASVEVFAAPKDHDTWTQTRYEIANRLEETKVQSRIVNGRYGAEIHTVMPTYDQNGIATIAAIRFLGINGDRWFMRITISGLAASEESQKIHLDEIISQLVVDRGEMPMAPGTRLPIAFPS